MGAEPTKPVLFRSGDYIIVASDRFEAGFVLPPGRFVSVPCRPAKKV